jgi:protein-histidine pros-kinase
MFGYAPPEIVGARVEVLMPERFRVKHTGHRDGYGRNGRVRPMGMGLELYGMRKDGTEFPVEISLSPMPQAKDAAGGRDHPRRDRAQAGAEGGRRGAPRRRARQRRQEPFPRHRQPRPAPAPAGARPAERRLRRMAQDPEFLEVLREQDQAIDAMSRLLNGLLDISKLESGAIRPEIAVFDLASLFDELRRDFAGLAASKGPAALGRYAARVPAFGCHAGRPGAAQPAVERHQVHRAWLGGTALRDARSAGAHRGA